MACSVTGQGGSFVLVDPKYQPVSAACRWTELAGQAVVRDLIDTFGETAYYRSTGWPPHGWLAICKLKQMVESGQLPPETRWVATVPDFICSQLTGDISTDITSAQITGLADFQGSQWSRDIAAWAGVRGRLLPTIVSDLGIVAEDVRTAWGKMTLVTGSHDQYAAMEAAGLEKNKSVMLGTGTAWVINGRTDRPLFDDRQFLIHPGRDLHPDCYGFIVTLWQIGAGLDRLLNRLGVTVASLGQIEDALVSLPMPHGPVHADVDSGTVEPAGDAPLSVRRYMEWAGSVVAHALDRCGLARGLGKIVVTGGAMQSRFWPQAIADICDLAVDGRRLPTFHSLWCGLARSHGCARPAANLTVFRVRRQSGSIRRGTRRSIGRGIVIFRSQCWQGRCRDDIASGPTADWPPAARGRSLSSALVRHRPGSGVSGRASYQQASRRRTRRPL